MAWSFDSSIWVSKNAKVEVIELDEGQALSIDMKEGSLSLHLDNEKLKEIAFIIESYLQDKEMEEYLKSKDYDNDVERTGTKIES